VLDLDIALSCFYVQLGRPWPVDMAGQISAPRGTAGSLPERCLTEPLQLVSVLDRGICHQLA